MVISFNLIAGGQVSSQARQISNLPGKNEVVHRRRINTEKKLKVVAAVWGPKLI